MNKLKIYTKTGDKGDTSLYGGKRVPKKHIRVDAYGSVDELNSLLGIAVVKLDDQKIKKQIETIQKDLFAVGSNLAGAENDITFLGKRIKEMEAGIDEMSEILPPLNNFILPQGTESAVFLYYSRAVVRRAERAIISLDRREQVDETILQYFNRLSDLLFILARFINFKAGMKETIWKSG